MKRTSVATGSQKPSPRYRKWEYNLYLFYEVALVKPLDDSRSMPSKNDLFNSTEVMMKRLLKSYVYNGFIWELNGSTSGELNDDKSSVRPVIM
jgi:hypothetical protein